MDDIDFYLPFWWDHVYEDFDPWADTWTGGVEHHKYLWEVDDTIPFDGVLFSREKIEESPKKSGLIKEAGGIRSYLDIPEELPLFGDCGAYGYREQDEPPYDPIESLRFYEDMEYDKACTVDHLITRKDQEDREERRQLTLENAKVMLDEYEDSSYDYDLYGVVQGWDAESYREGVEELVEYGFDNIAMGGFVRAGSKTAVNILKECSPIWRKRDDITVHVFGLARWKLIPAFTELGVDSVDNAYHRRAWMSDVENYQFGVTGGYTAVRVPLSDPYSKTRTEKEQAVFDDLRRYERGEIKAEEVMDTLEEYEKEYAQMKGKDSRLETFNDLYDRALSTLRERPWRDCDCQVCEEYGVHVAIFRTNERNMRRGFHNLYHFYQNLQKYLEGDLELPEEVLEFNEQHLGSVEAQEADWT